ncbi:hypothetical protein [Rhodoblastus sp.]|uniref:hypothetical protein n=1 Tax=Rhodoblastus sp. TaxID=1962975 RepID=UPI003F99351C
MTEDDDVLGVLAFTPAETQKIIKCGPSKYAELVQRGILPIVKLGKKTLVLKVDLNRMLSEGRLIAGKPAPIGGDVQPATPVPKRRGRPRKQAEAEAENDREKTS